MLRISKLADYAVMITVKMASRRYDWCSASDLVALTGLNVPTVRKILKLLSVKTILTARRGVSGGYLLSRGPNEISMLEVIEAIDGPIAFTECCIDEKGACQKLMCHMPEYWQLINRHIRQSLRNFKLSDLAVLPDNKTSLVCQ